MTGLLATFSSFTLFVLAHWAVCHFFKWRPHAKVLNGLWASSLLVYAGLFLYWSHPVERLGAGLVNFLNGLLINGLMMIGYTAWFFLLERGLSLRVMIEISRAPGATMTLEEIKKVYPYDYILAKRIRQILQMGYWAEKDGYFYSTVKGRRFAAAHKLVWKIFRIGKD